MNSSLGSPNFVAIGFFIVFISIIVIIIPMLRFIFL